MRTHYPHSLLAIALTSILLITGCSSNKQLIPDKGPDILDVYESHMKQNSPVPNLLREVHDERRDLAGYTRTAGTELNSLFPKLPNPELVMYVFPHLTAKGRPIPGYSTSFTMFDAVKYAMPGEIAP